VRLNSPNLVALMPSKQSERGSSKLAYSC